MVATAEQVLDWLEDVPDPEVPVLSVVDLGIIRKVAFDDAGACVVTITPTYSGCPAMLVISDNVGKALSNNGVERFRIETQLSPAWTTDWMSEKGKQKLKAYGIAPPVREAKTEQIVDLSQLRRNRLAEPVVECPKCGSSHTQVTSRFGSTSCKALYVCQDCHEPFDYFKTH